MTKIISTSSTVLKQTTKHRSFNFKYFNVVLFTGLAGLGVFYLVLVNNLTVQGFVLHKMNVEMTNLTNINRNSQEKINLAQSSDFLNSHLEDLNLVAVSNVNYLVARDSLVAKK
jgi:hypothetical protein